MKGAKIILSEFSIRFVKQIEIIIQCYAIN
jgi:hypothetical protein